MSISTRPMFDFAELERALEERDATAQLALYADDAEVTLVDRINTPGSPRVLRGREEIRGWIEDICERDMTHRVEMQVVGNGGAALTEACRYPDGTSVLCAAVLELRDGRIAREVGGPRAWGYVLLPLAAPHHRRDGLVFGRPSNNSKRSWPSPGGGRGTEKDVL